MAQRVAFAAATVGDAPVLIADEPSKGLDEQARADLAALLQGHVDAGGILLAITHDLELARQLDGDVVVMKEASIVEQGPAAQVLTEPSHPYTRRLLAAEPRNWRHSWIRPATTGDAAGAVLVEAEGITKAFGEKTLFTDLAVTIRAGERIALSGPSGSGKTTLGNILLRLIGADAGQVRHADVLGGGRLQKLYQDPSLAFPAGAALRASIGDVLRRHRLSTERLGELMATLRLPGALLDRKPGQVSGGELQRLAIIRAMMLDPVLMFADEPTSRLDLVTQEETMSALMQQVEQQGCALMLVTHDDALAGVVADRHIALASQDDARRARWPLPGGETARQPPRPGAAQAR
jgi:peptide/nickel transport system ATP-binding protein